MSFRAAQNIGLGILVVLLILVGLVPTLAIHTISEHDDCINRALSEIEETVILNEQFQSALLQFDRVVKSGESNLTQVLETLGMCVKITYRLKTLLVSASHEDTKTDLKSIESFRRNVRLFRIAVENYQSESEYDPASDNTHQMEMIALDAQARSSKTFSAYMNHKFKDISTHHKTINTTFRDSQKFSIVGLITGIFMAVVIALFLSRSPNNPIKGLLKGTQKISQGDLDSKLEVSAGGEFGILANAFEKMRKELRIQIEKQKKSAQKAIVAAKSEKKKSEELTHLNNRLESEIKVREQAEKKLTRSLKTTRVILESMPFGVIVVGKDKKIRMVNHASLEMMGVDSADGIINNSCHNRICPAQENECPYWISAKRWILPKRFSLVLKINAFPS